MIEGQAHIMGLGYSSVGNTTFAYFDGRTSSSAGGVTWSTAYNTLADQRIGGAFGTSEYFSGKVGEMIIYSTGLSAIELLKVNSYLALKYGITYDQSTGTSYVASDGSIMWSSTG